MSSYATDESLLETVHKQRANFVVYRSLVEIIYIYIYTRVRHEKFTWNFYLGTGSEKEERKATLLNEREGTNWQRGANRTERFVNIFILSKVDERKKGWAVAKGGSRSTDARTHFRG